jgi:hypothetical protein
MTMILYVFFLLLVLGGVPTELLSRTVNGN